jgi:putative PIN family toxin of toxin-antitoxin system
VRAVLDTNVVVSSFLSPGGTPARVIGYWRAGAFTVVVSESILAEYRRVLLRDRIRVRHGLTESEIDANITNYRRVATVCEPRETIRAVTADPSDDKFLECAVAGEADFVVSGDPHLLDLRRFRGIEIVSPATFLALLERDADR